MTTFEKAVSNPFQFTLFKLKHLPLAFVAGLQVKQLSEQKVVTQIKYNYLTKNPFKSMYFAAQAMAAELSTGVLVMNKVQQQKPIKISMLVYSMRADFTKKATGTIQFTCNEGQKLNEVIEKVKAGNDGEVIEMKSVGTNEQNEVVATFYFTWTLKRKN